MKRTVLRAISLFFAILFAAMPLASCSGSATIVKGDKSDYVIVYSASDKTSKSAATYLADQIATMTGVTLSVVDDRTEEAKKEIRVGRTNRGLDYELQRTVRSGQYVIAREKKHIYILGAGDGVLTRACKEFVQNVLSENYKVSQKGEILRSEVRYSVNTVNLNQRAITEYTLLTPEAGSDIDWSDVIEYMESQLSVTSGYLFTTTTYTSMSDLPYTPAIVLDSSTGTLGEGEYKIELDGDNIILSAGSREAALALGIKFIEGLGNINGDAVDLTFEAASGKMSDTPLMPFTEGSSIRVMTFNVYGSNEHKSLFPYVVSSMYAYGADFIMMQEFNNTVCKSVIEDMEKAGYGMVGNAFTGVSPKYGTETAPASHGTSCYTPIFYRSDLWEVVEHEAYLFHHEYRWRGSDSKSLVWAVFKNKSDGQQVLVIGTHFPLMTATYQENSKYPEYATYTNNKEGRMWRENATSEILAAVDAVRAKYAGILTVVGGDMNAAITESSMQNIENHAILSNAYSMAPAGAKTSGASFHDYGGFPGSGDAIDHIFVSEDVATVKLHKIVKDLITVQGSDHCPVIVDIARK